MKKSIRFVGTHIGAWSEGGVSELVNRSRMCEVLEELEYRGWKVGPDEEVLRRYPSISKNHMAGSKGDLSFVSEAHPAVFSLTVFQTTDIGDNPYGPRHDIYKFQRMTPVQKRKCAVDMTHVLRALVKMGYRLDDQSKVDPLTPLNVLRRAEGCLNDGDPLAKFNETWTSTRFDRDESGWPTAEEMYADRRRDRDGLPIEVGSVMYARDRGGRLFRGIARPLPNEQWALLSNGRKCDGYITARDLFRSPDGEPRRFIPGQSDRVMRELEGALKSKKLRRVEVLARTARLLSERSAA